MIPAVLILHNRVEFIFRNDCKYRAIGGSGKAVLVAFLNLVVLRNLKKRVVLGLYFNIENIDISEQAFAQIKLMPDSGYIFEVNGAPS